MFLMIAIERKRLLPCCSGLQPSQQPCVGTRGFTTNTVRSMREFSPATQAASGTKSVRFLPTPPRDRSARAVPVCSVCSEWRASEVDKKMT